MLLGGVPDAAGNVQLHRRAEQIGAVAAAYTVESWLGYVSVNHSGFERLAPDDLPRAPDLPDRREAVVTTAVWPGGSAFVHRITAITRPPGGSALGPACWMQARDYGTNRWLESLLIPTAAGVTAGADGDPRNSVRPGRRRAATCRPRGGTWAVTSDVAALPNGSGDHGTRSVSVPVHRCSTAGTATVPSDCWHCSRIAGSRRLVASPEALRVWTSCGLPWCSR